MKTLKNGKKAKIVSRKHKSTRTPTLAPGTKISENLTSTAKVPKPEDSTADTEGGKRVRLQGPPRPPRPTRTGTKTHLANTTSSKRTVITNTRLEAETTETGNRVHPTSGRQRKDVRATRGPATVEREKPKKHHTDDYDATKLGQCRVQKIDHNGAQKARDRGRKQDRRLKQLQDMF